MERVKELEHIDRTRIDVAINTAKFHQQLGQRVCELEARFNLSNGSNTKWLAEIDTKVKQHRKRIDDLEFNERDATDSRQRAWDRITALEEGDATPQSLQHAHDRLNLFREVMTNLNTRVNALEEDMNGPSLEQQIPDADEDPVSGDPQRPRPFTSACCLTVWEGNDRQCPVIWSNLHLTPAEFDALDTIVRSHAPSVTLDGAHLSGGRGSIADVVNHLADSGDEELAGTIQDWEMGYFSTPASPSSQPDEARYRWTCLHRDTPSSEWIVEGEPPRETVGYGDFIGNEEEMEVEREKRNQEWAPAEHRFVRGDRFVRVKVPDSALLNSQPEPDNTPPEPRYRWTFEFRRPMNDHWLPDREEFEGTEAEAEAEQRRRVTMFPPLLYRRVRGEEAA